MSISSFAKQGLGVCQVVLLALLVASCSKEEIPSYSIGTGSVTGSYRECRSCDCEIRKQESSDQWVST